MPQEYDFEKKMSLKFLQTLNRHLPKKRKTLRELLEEDKPGIKNMDGSTHYFDKKELEKLALIIPEWEHDKLRLPCRRVAARFPCGGGCSAVLCGFVMKHYFISLPILTADR